jgi:hypothetical protein
MDLFPVGSVGVIPECERVVAGVMGLRVAGDNCQPLSLRVRLTVLGYGRRPATQREVLKHLSEGHQRQIFEQSCGFTDPHVSSGVPLSEGRAMHTWGIPLIAGS